MSRVTRSSNIEIAPVQGNKRKQKDEDFVVEKRRVTRSGVHVVTNNAHVKSEVVKQDVYTSDVSKPVASLQPSVFPVETVGTPGNKNVSGLKQPASYEVLYDAFVRLDSAVFARVSSDQKKIVWFTSLKGLDSVDIEVDHLSTFAFLTPDMFNIACFLNHGKQDIRIEPLIIGDRPEVVNYDDQRFHQAYFRYLRAQIMRARLYFLVHFFHVSFIGKILQSTGTPGSTPSSTPTANNAIMVAKSCKDKVRDAYNTYLKFCGNSVGAEYQTELVRLLQDGKYEEEIVREKNVGIFPEIPKNWLRIESHDNAAYCEVISRLAKQMPRHGTPAKNRSVPIVLPELALQLWHFAFPLEKLPLPPKKRMDLQRTETKSLVNMLEEHVKRENDCFSPNLTPTSVNTSMNTSMNTITASPLSMSLTFLPSLVVTNHASNINTNQMLLDIKEETGSLTPMTPCLSEAPGTPTSVTTPRSCRARETPKSVVRDLLLDLSTYVSVDNVNISMNVTEAVKFYVPSSSSSSGQGENETIINNLMENVKMNVLKQHYERKEYKKHGGKRQEQLQKMLANMCKVASAVREYLRRGKNLQKQWLACSMNHAVADLVRTRAISGYTEEQYISTIQAITLLTPECFEIDTLDSGYVVMRHNMIFNLGELTCLVHDLEREQRRKLNAIEKKVEHIAARKSAPTKLMDTSFEHVLEAIVGDYGDQVPSLLS